MIQEQFSPCKKYNIITRLVKESEEKKMVNNGLTEQFKINKAW